MILLRYLTFFFVPPCKRARPILLLLLWAELRFGWSKSRGEGEGRRRRGLFHSTELLVFACPGGYNGLDIGGGGSDNAIGCPGKENIEHKKPFFPCE